jgi:hypothetical protein
MAPRAGISRQSTRWRICAAVFLSKCSSDEELAFSTSERSCSLAWAVTSSSLLVMVVVAIVTRSVWGLWLTAQTDQADLLAELEFRTSRKHGDDGER